MPNGQPLAITLLRVLTTYCQMWYHVIMLDTSETRPRRRDAEDISVQINVRVPYHYRETLIRLADETGMSLNRLVINALVAAYPPEQ